MNRHEHPAVSDEDLNAFIDDELDFEEKERVFEQLQQDDELNQEAHELRQLRALMRHAYRSPPEPAKRDPKQNRRSRGLFNSLAAGLLVAVGILGGWYGNQKFSEYNVQFASLTNQGQIHAAAQQQGNLLLHISSNDPAKMEAALNYAEQLLAEKRQKNSAFQLEVVANDGGVELLRRDTSPFPKRIEQLLTEYDNVSFLACANALRKLRARGVKVELLPGTRSDHTAIGEIVKRIEGGWNYLKV